MEQVTLTEATLLPAAGMADAGQWKLMVWRFRRHRLAVVSLGIVVLLYLVAIFAEFLAPYGPDLTRPQYTYAPPQGISFVDHAADGALSWNPHAAGYDITVDQEAMRRTFTPNPDKIMPLGFFVRGEPYKLWGLFSADLHLIGPTKSGEVVYLLGSDRLGRDVLSRLIYGTRISMSIGLVGVVISLALGLFLGGISGFYGGIIDSLIQRLIEVVSAMPTIPLWMGLAAAIPLTWGPIEVYFTVTAIVSLLGWTSLAREVRGRFFSLRGEDFVTAARFDGVGEMRIIFRHMLPSMTSHVLAMVTLAVPAMIIAETSLSFLGIGLKPPVVSWGVLLQDAQNLRAISSAPWLLLWPALAVMVAVLSFNFLGDGLRDAADPYGD
ncbi:MAG: Peptide transporter permease [Devosia sp.]|uniref:ABC transporter permease n=1 Tax=Devosia sp. TaxID=1871048 RepID=UPI0026143E78|nr:ABC transporter permease [Devosia sp.]MDB5536667.1 Binding-protein-dependent transport system inner rane component [Devosia sp.]MDB5588588.1 Peptide transporter permease [Devosia sp.]